MTNTYDGKHLTFEEQIELFEKLGFKDFMTIEKLKI